MPGDWLYRVHVDTFNIVLSRVYTIFDEWPVVVVVDCWHCNDMHLIDENKKKKNKNCAMLWWWFNGNDFENCLQLLKCYTRSFSTRYNRILIHSAGIYGVHRSLCDSLIQFSFPTEENALFFHFFLFVFIWKPEPGCL